MGATGPDVQETVQNERPPIMLIDNNPDTTFMYAQVLTSLYDDIPQECKCDGLADKLLRKGVPLRIITGILMSGIDGDEFIMELLRGCTLRGIPFPKVLFVSGFDDAIIMARMKPIQEAFPKAEISYLKKTLDDLGDIYRFAIS